MKKIQFLNLGLMIAFLSSCSSDKESSGYSSSPYMAGNINNYWTYDVKLKDMTSRDSIFISKDTVINKNKYRKIDTQTQPAGFYSSTLNKKGIKGQDDKILLSGKTDWTFSEQLPVVLDLNDFVIFKENSSPNSILSTTSGSVEKDFQNYPIKFDYSLKSETLTPIENFTINGVTYATVKPIKIVMNGKLSTSLTVGGMDVAVNIMKNQDVISSTLYYVKDIGVVYVNTSVQYNLEDFSKYGITLPFPQSFNENVEEFLHSYKNIY